MTAMRFSRLVVLVVLLVVAPLGVVTPVIDLLPASRSASAQTLDAGDAAATQLLQQGTLQAMKGQLQTTIYSWQQALRIYRQTHNRLGEGRALGVLGNAYHMLGDYPQAIDYLQQSLVILRQLGNRLGEGMSLNNLGGALEHAGKLPEAEKALLSETGTP